MMTIYTSYYMKWKKLPEGMTQVAISRGVPGWWKPERRLIVRELAPSAALLSACKEGRLTRTEWQDAYWLELLDKDLDRILEHTLPDPCVLLCWEKNWDDCHRKVAFRMLKSRYNVDGGEWGLPHRSGLSSQGELFS